MSIDNKCDQTEIKDTLRGRPFIRSEVIYEGGKGDYSIPHSCGACFYRDDDGKLAKDCLMSNKEPHKYFGIEDGKTLPQKLDGKLVGNYCPHWLDYRCD